MIRKKRLFFKLFFFVIALILVERVCYFKTEGFRWSKIDLNTPIKEEWLTIEPSIKPSASLIQMLDQSFYYLGSGHQCYVFASEDKQIVIKFFKFYRMQPSFWHSMPLPSPLKKMALDNLNYRFERLSLVLQSCQIAFNELQTETGVLFLHLEKGGSTLPILAFYDPLNNKQMVDLNDYYFIVQRFATPASSYFQGLICNENFDKAQNAIDNLMSLIEEQWMKNIAYLDPRIESNYGFNLDSDAVILDVGAFSHSIPASQYRNKLLMRLAIFEKELGLYDRQIAEYWHERVCDLSERLGNEKQAEAVF